MVTFIQLREPDIYSPIDILNTFFAMGEGVRKMQDYFKQQQDELTMQEIFRQIGEKLTKLPSLSEFITPQHREQVQKLLKSGASQEEVDAFIKQQTGGQLSLADFIEEERKRVKQEISEREQITPTPERVEKETMKRVLSELLSPKKETMQSRVGATPEEAREDVEKAYRFFSEGGKKGIEIDIPEVTAKQQVLSSSQQKMLEEEILKKALGMPNIIDILNLKNPYPEVLSDILSLAYNTPLSLQGRAMLFEQLKPALNVITSLSNIRERQIADIMQNQIIDAKTQATLLMNLLSLKQARELSEEGLALKEAQLQLAREKTKMLEEKYKQELELKRRQIEELKKTPDITKIIKTLNELHFKIQAAQQDGQWDYANELLSQYNELLDLYHIYTQREKERQQKEQEEKYPLTMWRFPQFTPNTQETNAQQLNMQNLISKSMQEFKQKKQKIKEENNNKER
jgi:hypothetical protein